MTSRPRPCRQPCLPHSHPHILTVAPTRNHLCLSPRSELGSLSFCRKLLFSATLTHNPEQLAPLNLVRPQLYSVVPGRIAPAIGEAEAPQGAQYGIPQTLTEHTILCEHGEKVRSTSPEEHSFFLPFGLPLPFLTLIHGWLLGSLWSSFTCCAS